VHKRDLERISLSSTERNDAQGTSPKLSVSFETIVGLDLDKAGMEEVDQLAVPRVMPLLRSSVTEATLGKDFTFARRLQ
jgi:hypothetical protein